ncbi:MAG: 2-phospho-L-lactate guanylyltransferase [Hyphomicrobiaceae bacterium]
MNETIVIPFRGPRGAKSRLDAVLEDWVRESLAMSLFKHVLSEVIDAGCGRVLVLTNSPEAASHAGICGVDVLRETTGSLNAALAYARKSLMSSGAERMAVIAADLPMLGSQDVIALLDAGAGGFAIAPDKGGSGTNAIAVPVRASFTFRYGHKSLAAHRKQASRLGLAEALVGEIGLAADLDEPHDLALLSESYVKLSPRVRRAIARARTLHDL